jgi:hypothetical protein
MLDRRSFMKAVAASVIGLLFPRDVSCCDDVAELLEANGMEFYVAACHT